ncbi:hypothetical protein AXFE_21320 [Acidithrix ferrooxidans]|uniref:Uncharacterized protein n=1 Tax=Acidithrix ferrooxidans TaxID=1280514 RepID=A0A0D8HGV7_9ACTN|nr:hypothetical protein AXFE_21320 [Acidithrix ferrooxidans]
MTVDVAISLFDAPPAPEITNPESTEMDQLEPLGVTSSRFFGTDLGLTEGLWLKSGFRVPNMTYFLCG